LSLLTNGTRLPRATVMLLGVTALFAIVIVGVGFPLPVNDGVGVGPTLFEEPPPHAAMNTTAASAANLGINRVHKCISRSSQ
jgi:hypothetical protein